MSTPEDRHFNNGNINNENNINNINNNVNNINNINNNTTTMATQDSDSLPFSASHHQQAFKLLELPPEVLALLESDNPPTLHLKSGRPSSPTAPAYAVLSTGTKSYQIRQKNTSNPIMVLQTSTTQPSPVDDAATFVPVPCVTSIAAIEDTLELVPLEDERAPAKTNKWHEKFAKTRNASK